MINEIEILKSQKLMNQVVIDMGLYAQIYVPGRVQNLLAYESCPVKFISTDIEHIQPTSGLVEFKYLPGETRR